MISQKCIKMVTEGLRISPTGAMHQLFRYKKWGAKHTLCPLTFTWGARPSPVHLFLRPCKILATALNRYTPGKNLTKIGSVGLFYMQVANRQTNKRALKHDRLGGGNLHKLRYMYQASKILCTALYTLNEEFIRPTKYHITVTWHIIWC